MDASAFVNFAYFYSFFAFFFAFGLATMWIYAFVVLDSWMGSMKGKPRPQTVYVNGDSPSTR